MIIVVTGGRRDRMSNLQRVTLLGILDHLYVREPSEPEVRHGGATGIDSHVEKQLKTFIPHIKVSSFPVEDWRPNGVLDKSLGPKRNREMLKGADLLIAFHGGPGTANCVKQAKEMGVPVLDLSVLRGL